MSYQENLRSSVTGLNAVKYSRPVVKPPYCQPNPLLFCLFCWSSNHISHECWKFKSSELFWKKILEDRRCKNCLRLYHQSNKCFNKSLCNIKGCSRVDKHSTVLCRQRYQKTHQIPNGHFHQDFSVNLRRHPSQSFWSRQDFVGAYSNNFSSFKSVFRKSQRKSNHRNKDHNHKWDTQTNNGSVTKSLIQINSVPTVDATVQNSEIEMFKELHAPHIDSKSCQVEICTVTNSVSGKIEVSTQTPNWAESKATGVDKFSQGTNTENSSVCKSVQTSLLIPPSTDIFQYFPVFVNGKSLKSNSEVNDEVNRSTNSDVDVKKDHKEIFQTSPIPLIANLKDGVENDSLEVVSPHDERKPERVSKPVNGDKAKINEGSSMMQESPLCPNGSNNLSSAPVPPISHLFRTAMETCISKLQAHNLQQYK